MMKLLKILFKTGMLVLAVIVLNGSICDNGSTPSDPTAGLYHTYAELNTELHDLAMNHPAIALVSSIGQSVENRELWAIKISDNVQQDEDEPGVVFCGAHHAREWISVDVPLLLAEKLIEDYTTDTLITRLVDNSEIWIVPMVNPDGHHHSVINDRLWRKNRRNNGDGTYGVDLNRNYSYQWGGPGSSGDTYSDIYRGPSPFSEPETRAVRDFLEAQEPKAMISYHSYSQLILYPWGYTNSPAPDKSLMDNLANAMSDKIRAVHGINYSPGQASTLYLASGDTADWLYALLATPSFTIELRPANPYPGFELPEDEIQPTFEENWPAAIHLIDWAVANN